MACSGVSYSTKAYLQIHHPSSAQIPNPSLSAGNVINPERKRAIVMVFLIPLRLSGRFVQRHEHRVGLDLARIAQFPAQELDQLLHTVLGNLRTTIDDDEGIESFV